MSPLSRLARTLKVHERLAWDFYNQVRAGLGENRLDIRAVVTCIEANEIRNPTPELVVRAMRRNEARPAVEMSPPKPSPPAAPIAPPPVKTGAELAAAVAATSGPRWKNRGRRITNRGSNAAGALRPTHDPRNYTQGLPRCEHGVLKTAICNICDPESFETVHGMD
jgi:hypothetical protein